jgi:hypothetical protein
VTFGARAAAGLRVYTCVVDDRVHAADPVDLVRDAPGLGYAAEITEHDA